MTSKQARLSKDFGWLQNTEKFLLGLFAATLSTRCYKREVFSRRNLFIVFLTIFEWSCFNRSQKQCPSATFGRKLKLEYKNNVFCYKYESSGHCSIELRFKIVTQTVLDRDFHFIDTSSETILNKAREMSNVHLQKYHGISASSNKLFLVYCLWWFLGEATQISAITCFLVLIDLDFKIKQNLHCSKAKKSSSLPILWLWDRLTFISIFYIHFSSLSFNNLQKRKQILAQCFKH